MKCAGDIIVKDKHNFDYCFQLFQTFVLIEKSDIVKDVPLFDDKSFNIIR